MKLTKFIIVILLILSLFSLVSIYTVTISSNVVMINNIPFFQVKVITTGSGSGVVVPPVVSPMPAGTVIKFKAIASPGSSFGGWSPNCMGPGDTCILPVQGDFVVVATFNRNLINSIISVKSIGSGRVISQDSKIICPPKCEGEYALGSQIILIAEAKSGSSLQSWSGCDSFKLNPPKCLVVNKIQGLKRQINAVFSQKK